MAIIFLIIVSGGIYFYIIKGGSEENYTNINQENVSDIKDIDMIPISDASLPKSSTSTDALSLNKDLDNALELLK